MNDDRTGLTEQMLGRHGLFFYPIYALLARILSRLGYRFLHTHIWLIEDFGQLAMDLDVYLKRQILSGRKVKPILLVDGRTPANEALLAHWTRYIHVVRSRAMNVLLRPFLLFPEVVDVIPAYSIAHGGASHNHEIQRLWGDRPPLLQLSEAEIAKGEEQLRAWGMPEGAWFVCVHSREGGFKPVHDWAHSFRNSRIDGYKEAMREIVARGGWCIRVGDATMEPLAPAPGIVDYARSPAKSAWMDVFLLARCRFLLGNTSGVFIISGIFGKRSALANMAPIGAAYSLFPGDITIPKVLQDASGRILSFGEALADASSEYHLATQFAERGLRHIDNTPQEIAELVLEMMDRLEGKFVESPEDAELQARFRALMRPEHYSWHSAGRIGAAFLRRHRHLLDALAPLEKEDHGS